MVRTAKAIYGAADARLQGLGDQGRRSISSRVINKFHKNRRYHRDTWRCWTSYCIHPVNHGPCINLSGRTLTKSSFVYRTADHNSILGVRAVQPQGDSTCHWEGAEGLCNTSFQQRCSCPMLPQLDLDVQLLSAQVGL